MKIEFKEDTVTISKKEYNNLLAAQKMLDALEGAGVDNWEGYEYAQVLYQEEDL